MATVTGTINSVSLISGNRSGRGDRKTYELGCSWSAAFTGSADIVALATVGATIASHTRNGKTNTMRSACGGQPGLTDSDADVYAGPTFTISSDTLQFDLVTSTGADLNLSSTKEDVQIIVSVDES